MVFEGEYREDIINPNNKDLLFMPVDDICKVNLAIMPPTEARASPLLRIVYVHFGNSSENRATIAIVLVANLVKSDIFGQVGDKWI